MKRARLIPARLGLLLLLLIQSATLAQDDVPSDDDPVFSGPQVGEKLTRFSAENIDSDEGETFDPIANANGETVFLVFVHNVTRPSIGLTRILTDYAAKLEQHGVSASVVLLAEDVTDQRQWAQRARRALPQNVPVGLFTDGAEGPGAYGLNRHVTMTVLVGKGNQVTANYALVQPSIQADGLKIAKSLASIADAPEPTLDSLGVNRDRMQRPGQGRISDGEFRAMIAPVIQKDATEEEIDEAAAIVEAEAARNPAFKKRVAEVTKRIIDAGRLETYGNEFSQAYLKKWAEEYNK